MNLNSIFDWSKKERAEKQDAPSHWIKCESCQALMYFKEIAAKKHVCPKCNYHMRISVGDRIALLADEGSFVEMDAGLKPLDPLEFVDKKSYKKRIEEGIKKTGRASSVISGECTVEKLFVQLCVFDFSFMGGSLGSVEGEKIARAATRALAKKQPLIIVSASGGARMQESSFSLMQMAKTSAAIAKLEDAKLPYISILTDPTMGGVSASFAFLGDFIIAEPGALIGFAGQRVIRQTIKAELPEGFQRAEFLLEKGLIDMVVPRERLKKTVADLLRFTAV